VGLSEVYENPAVGDRPQPDFLNAVVALEVDLDPRALQAELRRIEAGLGRARTADKYAPRTIDLDLLLYGDQVIQEGRLRVPDPELPRRAHLAIPLAELAPDQVHPELGESFATIAARLRPDSRLHPRPDLKLRLLAGRGRLANHAD
jgi:2-amino-4-hydroxy-6-hydroxymethyldihydropteridine diphosphokinase